MFINRVPRVHRIAYLIFSFFFFFFFFFFWEGGEVEAHHLLAQLVRGFAQSYVHVDVRFLRVYMSNDATKLGS